MKKILSLLLPVAILLNSCGDFLTEYSQNLSFVKSATDLDELLIGQAYISGSNPMNPFGLFHLQAMDDDVTSAIVEPLKDGGLSGGSMTYQAERLHAFYKFQAYPFLDKMSAKNMGTAHGWDVLYEKILAVNTIIYEIDKFKEDEKYNRIKGEAYFLRAFYYFYLTNSWGLPYSEKTADTDLGVPLKLDAVVVDKGYERNTVAECYDQMVKDLKVAIENLENSKLTTKLRAGYAAANAMLAKVYLHMGKYEEANPLLDVVMKDPMFYMCNMNGVTAYTWQKQSKEATSSECIFSGIYAIYGFQDNDYWSVHPSQELLDLYDITNDLRYKGQGLSSKYDTGFFDYQASAKLGPTQGLLHYNSYYASKNNGFGLSYPEVLLMKAEVSAMLGNSQDAYDALEILLKARLKVLPSFSETGEDLVKLVRTERRKELCFRYNRWFDLRRYAVAPLYPEEKKIEHIQREWDYNNDVPMVVGKWILNEFSSGDGGWVLPFPNHALYSNHGKLVDNERPDRELLPI